MKSVRHLPILAGTLALVGLTGVAQAATEVNIGGSSAGKNFATDVPLDLCDANPLPNRFSSANGNLITWTCNRGGLPVIMRYSATGSSDGVNKLLQPASNPASNMNFLDHTLTTGCTGPIPAQRASDNKQYNNTTGCADTNVISLPVIMGASDVKGSSFHQTGPAIPPPAVTINPLDDSTLNSTVTAIVPFSLFVGKGVKAVNSDGTIAGNISGLSRLQIEQIFARGVTDWQRLGLGTVTDLDPTVLETTSPIVLCLRNAGSGTKAAFDETVMINTTETAVPLAGNVIFNASTSGVFSCLAANRRSIGYMDSDQDVNWNKGDANQGLAYPIAIDGGMPPTFANQGNPTLSKRDLKCGKYPYWAGWRLNRRAAGEDAGGPIDALALAFVTDAGLQATIGILPTGKYWASDEELAVSKNSDKGPINWKVGNHPECR